MWPALNTWVKSSASRYGIGLYRPGEEWRLVEPAQLKRFLAHFAVDCVFDIGANEGQYGSELRKLGYSGRILSFEPHPDALVQLRANAANDPTWEVFDIALDSQARELEFNVMESSQFSSLLEPDHSGSQLFVDQNRVKSKVKVTTQILSTVLPQMRERFEFARPFLKMDTQGHDLEVFRGAGKSIEDFVGLQSELSLTPLYKGAPDFAQVIAEYRSSGFRLSGLIPNNAGHFPDLVEVDCLMYNPSKI